MNNSQDLPPALEKLLPILKRLLPVLQNLLPALVVALAVLGGLLGGAKIISNGVIEANRFQVIKNGEYSPDFLDTATGGLYSLSPQGWRVHKYLTDYRVRDIDSGRDWVMYLERTKFMVNQARKDFYD